MIQPSVAWRRHRGGVYWFHDLLPQKRMWPPLAKPKKEKQDKAAAYFAERYTHYYENEKREVVCHESNQKIRFVFVREDGTYITPRTMQHTSRIIHNELNIKEFDFHSLRHTHATILAENGVNPKALQNRMGHEKIETTFKTYIHKTNVMEDESIELFERAIAHKK